MSQGVIAISISEGIRRPSCRINRGMKGGGYPPPSCIRHKVRVNEPTKLRSSSGNIMRMIA